MHGLMLLFSLHLNQEHSGGDRWFAVDKAKHFFTAALVQTVSFSGLRSTGLGRTGSLLGASAVTSAVSIGKEVYDKYSGGTPSGKDLTWDAAGMIAAIALLRHTER